MKAAVTSRPIHRIEVPTPFRIGAVNVYLLEGDPLTLVDTGPLWQPARAAVEDGLRVRGRRIEDLELILVTHQHVDHFGLAGELQRRSGAVLAVLDVLEPYLSDADAAWLAEDDFAESVMRRYGTPAARISAIRAVSESFKVYRASAAVDRTFTADDEIAAGGRSLRVLPRPGHSPTDTIFVDESDGIAFGGDHLLARVSSNPVIHRPPGGGALREETLPRYLVSLGETEQLGLRTVFAGHGDSVNDVPQLIASRLRHYERRKETIAEMIAAGSRSVGEIAQRLWGDVETSQVYLALSEVVGHTDLLRAEGRLREWETNGIVEFAETVP